MYNKISDRPLYSSRIIHTFIKLLRRKYPAVDIDEVLAYAGMKSYEVEDQGHWFSQEQIDRFYAIVLKKTGNRNIAREAGRYAASPETMGVMRQYFLGLIGPAKAYERVGMASARLSKSAVYKSRRLSGNTIEITVTPKEGVREKKFQCDNRMGFWDAIAKIFNTPAPVIEHPECIFRGGKVCRYIISWNTPRSALWKKLRNLSLFVLLLVCLWISYVDFKLAWTTILPFSAALFFGITIVAERLEKEEVKSILSNLRDTSDKLIDQIETNYNNSRLTNEIGQTITSQTNIEDVLTNVVQSFRKRLNYDRGLILLANPNRTRLIFRAGFGYTPDKLELLKKSAFHLDKPDSKGIFVVCFREQKPFLINDINEIGHSLSTRSQAFAREMGSQSFICCPITCDGESLGVLAVDNLRSKKPLVESDLSLLMGISHVIGISVRNVELLDARDKQMQSILQVLAATIDARDPLTAGHSEKVTEYALGISHELGLPNDYCEAIRVAALLHDYGKIGVPDAILKKPGRLTKQEHDIVKTHAEKTRQILEQINFTGNLRQVPEIASAHHEKIDGSGYPLGLKGEEIPLGARIIAVADFFEAITAKRHYRDPLPLEMAFHLLQKERGVHFEKRIVDAFIRYYTKTYIQGTEPRQITVLKRKVS